MAYLSDIFTTFANIPAASDADLQDWVTLNCTAPSVADYEDSHVNIVRAWMYALTGIPWYRSYEHGARPEAQYGTVHFSRANLTPRYQAFTSYEQRENGDFCSIVREPMEYVYILSVYRETGDATNQQAPTASTQPVFSSPDPLIKAKTRAMLPLFRNALREYCLQYDEAPFSAVTNLPQIITQRYEHRSTCELRIIAYPAGSVRVPHVNSVDVGFCEDV